MSPALLHISAQISPQVDVARFIGEMLRIHTELLVTSMRNLTIWVKLPVVCNESSSVCSRRNTQTSIRYLDLAIPAISATPTPPLPTALAKCICAHYKLLDSVPKGVKEISTSFSHCNSVKISRIHKKDNVSNNNITAPCIAESYGI